MTEYAVEEFNEVLYLNVTEVWLLMKYAIPLMKKNRRGSFLVTTAGAGVVGVNWSCPYLASKHTVNGLMKTACLEFGGDNLRFNSLALWPIGNRMMQSICEQLNTADPSSVRNLVTESIRMRRYGANEEIAYLALFLVSDESSFCNGGVYLADGGSIAG